MKHMYRAVGVVGVVVLALFSAGCIESPSADDGSDSHAVVIIGKGGYDVIQQAIDNASSGDTIVVYNGTYSEQVVIDKSLTLMSAEKHSPVLRWNETMLEGERASVLLISAHNCTVDGLTIRGSGNILGDLRGIRIDSDNNRVSNNTVINTTHGIYSYVNKNNSIFNNKLRGNNYGVYLSVSEDNHVYENTISLSSEYGMYIHLRSDNNVVSKNDIMDNVYGIRIKGATNNHVRWNTISGNEHGVYCCCGSAENMIYLNQFVNNSVWNAQDDVRNRWDNGSVGNYWDDYTERYPEAQQVNNVYVGLVWNTPYSVTVGSGGQADQYPLVDPIKS